MTKVTDENEVIRSVCCLNNNNKIPKQGRPVKFASIFFTGACGDKKAFDL